MFIIGHWSGVPVVTGAIKGKKPFYIFKSTVYMGRENSHVFDTLEVVGSSWHSFETDKNIPHIHHQWCLCRKIMSHDKYEAWTILDIDHRICIFIDPRPSL